MQTSSNPALGNPVPEKSKTTHAERAKGDKAPQKSKVAPSKSPPAKLRTRLTESERLLRANLLLVATTIILAITSLCLTWYALLEKVEVIAVTESGAIINPVPLNTAYVTDTRVLSFSDECIRSSFSHDFENYRRTINAALPCYTAAGAKEFTAAIDPLLLEIKNKRVVMSITTEPAVIVRGPMNINSRVTWEVQMVMTMFFSGTKERYSPQQRLANISIVRVPIEEDARGIGIHAIQLAPYTPSR